MSWRSEKTKTGQDLVWDGVERGIAPSPLFGTANIQNANIATQSGQVLASYGRTNQTQEAIAGGTLTPDGATLFDAPATLKAGTWIQVTASTVMSITASTGATTVNADYLSVAGGGGGGGADGATFGGGGGGGAGAMRTGTGAFGVGDYAITVGVGGAGGLSGKGTNGSDSVISSIVTSVGGGGGGYGGTTNVDGNNGGSGGGGGAIDGTTAGVNGTGTTGGNNGGDGAQGGGGAGGGGGGAGGVGSDATAVADGNGGNGGTGSASSISGVSTTYAGGGGGGGGTDGGNVSSLAGGGAGGSGNENGADGTDGKGGGGGGAGCVSSNQNGGDGGSGIVIISYATNSMLATGGVITYANGKTIHTFYESGTFTVISLNTGGYYFVSYKTAANKIKLSAQYDPYAEHALTHGTTGSITFSTVAVPGSVFAKATEKYGTATGLAYRYYVLDTSGRIWVYDSDVYASTLAATGVGTTWMLPDYADYSTFNLSGIAVIAGWLIVPNLVYLQAKPTTDLGRYFGNIPGVALNNPLPTHKNFAIAGNQGKVYYCDGTYIGEIFPTTSLITSIANIQSNSQFTASSTIGTITKIISDSIPYSSDGTRIPAVFYTDRYGALPTAITEGVVYYIAYNSVNQTFSVYTTPTSATALDIATGASGNQYFNTFFPMGIESGADGSTPLVQVSSQRLNLPNNEIAQSLVEIGNLVLVGCAGNIVYPWNQVDATPSDVIALPESNVKTMINVNNMAYIFAGNKGNIYVSNGSIASLALKVPDYCAGVPGTTLTYIEPYFTWGDAIYVRGRVYFSILDQTATKAGNCGGVWSFVPTQNIDPTQDIGISLRLENQNSYGNYSGYSTILIGNEEQAGSVTPQYWSWWQTSYSTGTSTFGVDQSSTTPVTQFIVETDLLPSGTMLDKSTFSQIEYKVATPLVTNDAIQLYYRINGTDAWTSCGTVKEESDRISGYFDVNFQKTQWIQFRAVCTTGGTTASSFVRLTNIRVR